MKSEPNATTALKPRVLKFLQVAGLPVLEPFVHLVTREDPRGQLKKIGLMIGMPILSICLFLGVWHLLAQRIRTKFGTIPTPGQVWTENGNLWQAHADIQQQKVEFRNDQKKKAANILKDAKRMKAMAAKESDPAKKEKYAKVAGQLVDRVNSALNQEPSFAPTFPEQIVRSLFTVFAGFIVASLIAIPIGIICGVSILANSALNPLIQVLKPVSPVAWLPIVMIVVASLYTTDPAEAWFERAFISSAITVALCSLWPTLMNTTLGVAAVDKDYLNVAKVLKLNKWQQLFKIIIPASLPIMFAGLRISLSVGWMVLVAADMLAQNPGLGKFVWDMYQNGSSQTMAQIFVAGLWIGIVGFMLDRIMVVMRNLVSFEPSAA